MIAVCRFDELVDGSAVRTEVDGVPVAVVRIGDSVHAIADTCSHQNISLAGGTVWCDERQIECPKHGSRFDLLTGHPDSLPATRPVEVFDARVVDGGVVVERRTA